MANIPSPANLNMSDSRALKTWLYQLQQAVGGNSSSGASTTIITDLISNQILTKQTIIDVGSTYVQDVSVDVVDADISESSIITASIAPVGIGYARPYEEVIYERLMVYAIPKNGSITFYIQPERGTIKGEFLINYGVKK